MHHPVLVDEVVRALVHQPNGFYCDATFGRGGHSQAILQRLSDQARLVAIDQDPQAEDHARAHFKQDERFQFIPGNFAQLEQLLVSDAFHLDGLLLDLGVSSPQLDEAQRGFSFNLDGPLDMRMNPSQGLSAQQWLQSQPQSHIQACLKAYADVTHSKRWSRLIQEAAWHNQLQTTKQLAELIVKHTPKRAQSRQKHPATQIFQAIRMAVNDELEALDKVLKSSLKLIKKAGRLVVISFHSIEHRLIRQFSRGTLPAERPANLAIPVLPNWRVIKLLHYPSEAEIKRNRRARSARLTVLERLPTELSSNLFSHS